MSTWSVAQRLGLAGPLAMGALVPPPLGSIVLFMTMGTTGPWLQSHAGVGVVMYDVATARCPEGPGQ